MLDWNDLRNFLAIARHGTLSAAARSLKVTQTTMGRRLEALHARSGARLLRKTPSGFTLTSAGERVVAGVKRMEAEAHSIERAVAGENVRIAGEVRITTVEILGGRVLVPILKPLLDRQPELAIELITDKLSLSLSRREADIALRVAPFERHEIVVRRVGGIAFALYASRAYIEQNGRPDFTVGAEGHTLVTLQEDLSLLPEARRLAELAPKARVALRANSREAQLRAVLAGYGLACLPCFLAREHPEIVELAAPGIPLVRGIWLGVHRDSRNIPRLRIVLDHLAEGLYRLRPLLKPHPAVNDKNSQLAG